MLIWVGFFLLIFFLLALDLGVFHRRAHVIHVKEALGWTGIWIFVSLVFNVYIYFAYQNHWAGLGLEPGHLKTGKEASLLFFTGYLVEKSLSLDNIFVMAMIFSHFRIPSYLQHRVLFWGILGALVLRGVMIGAGVALIEKFFWMTYIFGGLLIFTAVKMLVERHDTIEPEKNVLIRAAKKLYPMTDKIEGARFFVKSGGRKVMTPLFLVLLIIESTDLLFAVDSIPAIFSITTDPYIVFTSNVFAILGLRSLYFALAAMMDKFRYLKISIVFILVFVGIKMILSHTHEIPIVFSLTFIGTILSIGIYASILANRKETRRTQQPL
jgi:tellurite resistance protein TerC